MNFEQKNVIVLEKDKFDDCVINCYIKYLLIGECVGMIRLVLLIEVGLVFLLEEKCVEVIGDGLLLFLNLFL